MMSAERRMSSARSVTSRRLPMGVATTYNAPGSARNGAIAPGSEDEAPDVPVCATVLLSIPRFLLTSTRLRDLALGALLAMAAALCGAQTGPASQGSAAAGGFGPPPPS